MQGYFDMPQKPVWDKTSKTLSGTSTLIGGEEYKIMIAANGFTPAKCLADNTARTIKVFDEKNHLYELILKPEKIIKWN